MCVLLFSQILTSNATAKFLTCFDYRILNFNIRVGRYVLASLKLHEAILFIHKQHSVLHSMCFFTVSCRSQDFVFTLLFVHGIFSFVIVMNSTVR